MRRQPGRVIAAIFVGILAFNATSGGTIRGSGDPAAGEAREAALQAEAERAGALGIYADGRTGELVVVLPKSSVSRFSEAAAESSGLAVRVEATDMEPADVDRIAAELVSRSWDPRAGAAAFGFYFDAKTATIVIEGDSRADVFAEITAAYPGMITYRRAEVSQRDSRTADATPHVGGAALRRDTSTGSGVCTSGFAVENLATEYMVTAAHCFGMGVGVESPGNGSSFGEVVSRGPFPEWDMEILHGANYIGKIWVGNTTGTRKNVIAAGNPTVGFTGYCTSTWQAGSLCGKTVTSLNGTFCDVSGCTPGLIVYSGGTLTQPGDSGSPFYLDALNGVSIRGLHIARTGSTMYAHKWSTVAAHWGVEISTN